MNSNRINRRQFLATSTLVAGAAVLGRWSTPFSRAAQVKRTAVDQVTLGKTGIRLSRLGIGTGSSSGAEQTALGKQEFINLVHYAYDHGITYVDTAQAYRTFGWIGDAIQDLPREKLYLQSKVDGRPEDVMSVIDHHRKTFNTDYVDTLLVHCMTQGSWTDQYKRVMDAFDEAKQKKWIRAKGVSCHTLPALKAAAASSWNEVHLVRVNPQGNHMDGMSADWGGHTRADTGPVLAEIKSMHDQGRGVIGMKIIGNGDFTNPDDREKSIRFAMSCKDIDAIVIGFTSRGQIDEAIGRMNSALAA